MKIKIVCALVFAVQCFAAVSSDSGDIVHRVYTSLESRLTIFKQLEKADQPLFIQQNPSVRETDLVEAVYINDDPDALRALADFFKRDKEPVYTSQQLKDFLAADLHTASVWRNRTSASCIITINTRRMEAATFGIEHEVTHVMQHAEIACVGEAAFVKSLYKKLGDRCPEAIKEITHKYPQYELDLERLETLAEQERFAIVQVLLEYDADVHAAELLAEDAETLKFIGSKVQADRCKPYASYELLYKIMTTA